MIDRSAFLSDVVGVRGRGRPRNPAPAPESLRHQLDTAAVDLKQRQAQKLEIENAKRLGELLPVEEVRATWGQMVIDLRQAILAIPSRITGLSRAQMVQLDAELREALGEISRDRA
ncbi:MAG: hypothetical protein WAT35_03910 [Tabrizicola sp.]|jgi:phage terminase Nu1 subunit (DNA packaging protein)|uniref:hypothetical protein n=1 Tax=Tabrizicola sp. TaxID=2005166 RepID=UPI003BB175F5